MELFPDGEFVVLQNRATSNYLHADADWVKVSLRPNGAVPSLSAVWLVQHWVDPYDGHTFVLLQNAAYGRYLSFSLQEAPSGNRGRRTTQLDRRETNVLSRATSHYPWMWRVDRLTAPDQDYVRLSYFNCILRANGRYLSWNTRVTADPDRSITTMMHWKVREVPSSRVRRPLPVTLEDKLIRHYCTRHHHEHPMLLWHDYGSGTSDNVDIHLLGNQKHLSTAAPDIVTRELSRSF